MECEHMAEQLHPEDIYQIQCQNFDLCHIKSSQFI